MNVIGPLVTVPGSKSGGPLGWTLGLWIPQNITHVKLDTYVTTGCLLPFSAITRPQPMYAPDLPAVAFMIACYVPGVKTP
jgi:hypothetical protein